MAFSCFSFSFCSAFAASFSSLSASFFRSFSFSAVFFAFSAAFFAFFLAFASFFFLFLSFLAFLPLLPKSSHARRHKAPYKTTGAHAPAPDEAPPGA